MEIDYLMKLIPEESRRSAFFLGSAWTASLFANLEPLMSDECAQKAKELVLTLKELERKYSNNPER